MKRTTKKRLTVLAGLVLILCILIPFASARTATEDMLLEKVQSTVERGKINYATLYDIDDVSRAALQTAASAALKAGGKVFFNFDSLVNSAVVARITVNPHLIKTNSGSMNMTIDVSDTAVSKVRDKAKRALGNKVAVLQCKQADFGMTVVIAAKLDTTGFDTSKLKAYSYDPDKAQYTALEKSHCYVDKNGFTFLSTKVGGYLVIVG